MPGPSERTERQVQDLFEKAGESDVVKVTLNLLASDVEMIKEIASTHGLSLTDAVRRAIATQKFLDDVSRSDSQAKRGPRIPGLS